MVELVYVHDGSFEGLLTALALSVKSEEFVNDVVSDKQYQANLFDKKVDIETDKQQAQKLVSYLKGLGGIVFKTVFDNYLSEDVEIGIYLSRFISLSLKHREKVVDYITDESVLFVVKNAQKVAHEAHKFLGFIRFMALNNGVLYAPIEPDYNIIGYCADHFRKRLKNEKWIIHDVKRNLALFWDKECLQSVVLDNSFSEYVAENGEVQSDFLHGEEKQFQRLWQIFHSSISNSSRENHILQRQFMPARYWKYMIEMKN